MSGLTAGLLTLAVVGLYAAAMHVLGRLAFLWVRHYRAHRATNRVANQLRSTFTFPVHTRSLAPMYVVGLLILAGAVASTWTLPVVLDAIAATVAD